MAVLTAADAIKLGASDAAALCLGSTRLWSAVAVDPVHIASSAAALTATFAGAPADGDQGLIAVGAGLDERFVHLVYDGTRAKWVSEPTIAMRMTDQAGDPLGFIARSQLGRDQFSGNPADPAIWWSFTSPRHIDALQAAGLSLEYRDHCWIQDDGSDTDASVGAYIYSVAASDAIPHAFDQPITGGQAQVGTYLHGGGPQSTNDFEWLAQGWKSLAAVGTGLTKSDLYPVLTGALDAGASGAPPGFVIVYALALRWAG